MRRSAGPSWYREEDTLYLFLDSSGEPSDPSQPVMVVGGPLLRADQLDVVSADVAHARKQARKPTRKLHAVDLLGRRGSLYGRQAGLEIALHLARRLVELGVPIVWEAVPVEKWREIVQHYAFSGDLEERLEAGIMNIADCVSRERLQRQRVRVVAEASSKAGRTHGEARTYTLTGTSGRTTPLFPNLVNSAIHYIDAAHSCGAPLAIADLCAFVLQRINRPGLAGHSAEVAEQLRTILAPLFITNQHAEGYLDLPSRAAALQAGNG